MFEKVADRIFANVATSILHAMLLSGDSNSCRHMDGFHPLVGVSEIFIEDFGVYTPLMLLSPLKKLILVCCHISLMEADRMMSTNFSVLY